MRAAAALRLGAWVALALCCAAAVTPGASISGDSRSAISVGIAQLRGPRVPARRHTSRLPAPLPSWLAALHRRCRRRGSARAGGWGARAVRVCAAARQPQAPRRRRSCLDCRHLVAFPRCYKGLTSTILPLNRSLLFVRTATGTTVPVQVPNESQLDGVTTGQPISVQGQWQSAVTSLAPARAGASPPRTFVATAIVQHATSPTLAPQTTGMFRPAGGSGPVPASTSGLLPLVSNALVAAELTVLFIPIMARDPATGKACPGTTGLPTVSKAALEAAIFEDKAAAGGPTLASTFRSCSLGKTKLSPATSLVLDPLELPCSGNM